MGVLALIGITLGVFYILVSILLWKLTPRDDGPEEFTRQKHAAVVVLGDLGHSPRMNFHALSIANCGWKVSLIGYVESELMEAVRTNPNISVVELPAPQRRTGSYLSYAVKRVLGEHIRLYRTLSSIGRIDVVLVQNPPSIPTLASARWFTLWGSPGTKLLIDWHNLGYSILSLTQKRIYVTLYRAYEIIFGRIAYLHLVVSVRLGVALKMTMSVNPKRVLPLPDRPFKSHVLAAADISLIRRTKGSFVEQVTSSPKSKLVVTSTSYTPDEDLGLFLQGLIELDKIITLNSKSLPHIDVVVTGKGPGKEAFLKEVAELDLKHITVRTAWLSYENYHRLLAVSDVGVSLHKSSSGVDLPMKVVDMFGAGLPVTALDFPALKELVTPANGLTFTDADSLASTLKVMLTDDHKYAIFKAGALKESENTWEKQWVEKLGPVFGVGQYTGIESSSSSDSD